MSSFRLNTNKTHHHNDDHQHNTTTTTTERTTKVDSFIPSQQYIGRKVGYYFRNDSKGVGYYRDDTNVSITTTTISNEIPATTTTTVVNPKKRNRSVRINEEHNETRTYTTSTNELLATIPITRIKRVNDDNNNNDSTTISDEGERLLHEAEEKVRQQETSSLVYDVSNPNSIDVATKAFVKVVTSNEVVRSQYPDDPVHYMDSEIFLYEHIVALKVFGINPTKFFTNIESFQQNFFSTVLLPLLVHPNPDIVEAIISLFLEWFDPTIFDDPSLQDDDDNDDGTTSEQTAIVFAQLLSILVQEGAFETIVQTMLLSSSSSDTTTKTNDDSAENDTDDDQVGNGWKDVIQFVENILEIESIIQIQYPSVQIQTSKQSINKRNDTSSSSLSSLLSISGKLVQDTKIVSWLFEQIDNYLTNSKTNIQRGLQSDLDQQDDRKNEYDSIVEKCNRALEILVIISSKEDVYTIVPNWSRIPKISTATENGTIRKKRKGDDNDDGGGYDGIELLLLIVAQYKKRQPVDDNELEQLENTALVLASLLLYSSTNVQQFVQQLQGIELVYRCCNEQIHAAGVLLKVLDFTCNDPTTNQMAYEYIITSGGLKYIFPLFVGKHLPKMYEETSITTATKRKKDKEWYSTIETTIIRILYGITRYITETSPQDAKERFLAKFVPISSTQSNGSDTTFTNTARCDKLIELLYKYEQKVRVAEYKFYKSDFEDTITTEDDANEREQIIQMALLDAKLQAGGDIYHRLAAIIAYCCAGTTNCHTYIYNQLQQSSTTTMTNTKLVDDKTTGGDGTGMTLVYDALTEFITLIPDENTTQKQQLESYLLLL